MDIHDALRAALRAVIDAAGTDLVLTIGSPPMIRLDGAIRPVPGQPVIDAALMQQYLADLLDGDQHAQFELHRDEDFAADAMCPDDLADVPGMPRTFLREVKGKLTV